MRMRSSRATWRSAPMGRSGVRRKGDRLLLTAKRGSGLSREEAEIELDREPFERLWPLTEGRRLHKRRHVIPHGDLEDRDRCL